MAQQVKNPPAMQKTQEIRIWSLSQGDPLEEGKVTHSSLLARKIPWTEELVGYSPFQFSCSVVSYSLWPHGLQHTRLLCPSPTPRVCSNSCPSSRWCHPTISSSVIPFSSCFQSFPASGSFQISQFFPSGGQSIGVSASASVLPVNIQDWSPLGWTGWISLQSKGLSRVFSNTTLQKHQFFGAQLSLESNPHIHKWPLGYSPEGHKELDTTEHDHKTRWTTWLLSGREESFNDG